MVKKRKRSRQFAKLGGVKLLGLSKEERYGPILPMRFVRINLKEKDYCLDLWAEETCSQHRI